DRPHRGGLPRVFRDGPVRPRPRVLRRGIRASGRRAFRGDRAARHGCGPGRTALGARAARSHTAALAGDWEIARTLLEGAGAVVAVTLDMFEDYVKIFTMLADRLPSGRRLAVLSNAGFECG